MTQNSPMPPAGASSPSEIGPTLVPPVVRELLTAAAEGLNLPLALTDTDDQARGELLTARASDVRIILAAVARAGTCDPVTVKQLRTWIAQRPASYRAWSNSGEPGQ